MTFYFVMTNSWSLLYDEMYGPDDEANLLKWKEEQLARGLPMTDDVTDSAAADTVYAAADHAALGVRDGTVRKTALEGGRRRPLLELLASSSYSSLFVWTIRMANFALDCFSSNF